MPATVLAGEGDGEEREGFTGSGFIGSGFTGVGDEGGRDSEGEGEEGGERGSEGESEEKQEGRGSGFTGLSLGLGVEQDANWRLGPQDARSWTTELSFLKTKVRYHAQGCVQASAGTCSRAGSSWSTWGRQPCDQPCGSGSKRLGPSGVRVQHQ